MKPRDVVLSVVVSIDEKGEFYGSAMLGEVALVTGPWTTLDALLHSVGREWAARQKLEAEDETDDVQDVQDARAWIV
jgi:hypothetical protein